MRLEKIASMEITNKCKLHAAQNVQACEADYSSFLPSFLSCKGLGWNNLEPTPHSQGNIKVRLSSITCGNRDIYTAIYPFAFFK